MSAGPLQALYAAGKQHLKMGAYEKALADFNRVLAEAPEHATAHYQKGRALFLLKRPGASIAAYREALRRMPDEPNVLVAMGINLYAMGDFPEAEQCYERALALRPGHARCLYNLVQLKALTPEDAPVRQLLRLHADAAVGGKERALVCFALGRVYEGQKDLPAAFSYYEEGNRAQHAASGYDARRDMDLLERIENTFSADMLGSLGRVGLEEETPIFIVGMPRSGSTLVARILASHSAVWSAGEVGAMPEVAMRHLPGMTGKPFPDYAKEPGRAPWRGAAKRYLDLLESYGEGRPRIADKMLDNYLYIGLIHLLLPRARILHCVRDAMDTCYSVYKHYFENVPYAYDLETLGRFYRRYERLMAHWRRALPGRVHDVRYEALLERPEEEIQRLLSHCGLEWEEACLRFHETKRPEMTASAMQVRKPLYKTSLRAWEPVADRLEPLRRGLGMPDSD